MPTTEWLGLWFLRLNFLGFEDLSKTQPQKKSGENSCRRLWTDRWREVFLQERSGSFFGSLEEHRIECEREREIYIKRSGLPKCTAYKSTMRMLGMLDTKATNVEQMLYIAN